MQTESTPSTTSNTQSQLRTGVLLGLSAYILWGFFPLYFSLFQGIPAWEVLLHRIIWACLFLVILITLQRRWQTIRAIFRVRAYLGRAFACSLLIALNWGTYIYAIELHNTLQASLGYFLTPLVNVALGAWFLRERPTRLQWLAITIAAAAILMQTLWMGIIPWLALILALSFGFYGLIRKQLALDGLSGLFLETALLTPFALAVFLWQWQHGQTHFAADPKITALFLSSGILTAIPLLLFAEASHRLRLSTLGFLMYISPSCQFALAIFYFGEPLHTPQILGFIAIWVALALYSLSALRSAKHK